MAQRGRSTRRRAGRSAQRVARGSSSSIADLQLNPKGTRYKPLRDREVEQIHHTALDVLEKIGLADPIQELSEIAIEWGCSLDSDGRLRFPRSLVEEAIEKSSQQSRRRGVTPGDEPPAGARVSFSTSGESIRILDFDTRRYRPSTLIDLYDASRLSDQLEHIHHVGQLFIATEYSDNLFVHDINVAYALRAGTKKEFSLSVNTTDCVEPVIRLLDMFAGGDGKFLEDPFCSLGGCPIVSPLRFAKDSTEVLVKCAKLGLDYGVAVASQAGATAPAALAGSLVQTFAESLACLTTTYMVNPAIRLSFGMWPFVSDLRTGAFTGGGPEQTLLMAATAQISEFYGLTCSIAAGMTDAKLPDNQAGFEKGITTLAATLAGAPHITPYPGAVGSLIATSFESMVIDNDMMGSVLRIHHGIDVSDETLSFDTIRDAVYGSGHFLDAEQTLKLMRSEYLYPKISDRSNADDWMEKGSKDIYEVAHERVKTLLADYYPEYIEPTIDAKIRETFPIMLKPEDMKSGSKRWSPGVSTRRPIRPIA
jgi:trimethylamine--corrinoid protein Co-methyltransferase